LVCEAAATLKEFVKLDLAELLVANQCRQEQYVEFSLLIGIYFANVLVGVDTSDESLGCARVDLPCGIVGCGPDVGYEIDNVSDDATVPFLVRILIPERMVWRSRPVMPCDTRAAADVTVYPIGVHLVKFLDPRIEFLGRVRAHEVGKSAQQLLQLIL
jgi:hypothetical protein